MPCIPVGPCYENVSGVPGPQGSQGAAVLTSPPTGQPGAPGKFAGASTFYTAFITVLDPQYSSILLHDAENKYINNDIPETIAKLVWLKGLLEARLASPASLTADSRAMFTTHRYRADALLQQIALSLDYYGQYYNVVPLLTVETYIGELDELLAYGRQIETSYYAFNTALQQNSVDQTNLNSARENLLQQNADLTAALAENVKQRDIVEANIAVLDQKLQDLWSQMAQAQRDFQDAVDRASGGCGFGQVVAIGAMVATLVATGGAASAAVGPALLALQNQQQKNGQTVPVPDTFDGFKFKVDKVVTLGKDAQNFVEAANQLKSSLTPAPGPGMLPPPPNDEAKIIAQSKDIDSELDKYKNLPQAQAYKALIDNYVTTAQAKNNMILQVNALYRAWDNTNSQIQKNQLDATAIQDNISGLTDPRLAKATLFMISAYRQSIEGIKFALYNIYRAYTYYTLDSIPFSVDDTNMATLGHAKIIILQQYYNALAAHGAAPGPFVISIDISAYLANGALQAFVDGGGLTFALPADAAEFKAASRVMTHKVSVSFSDGQTELTSFSVDITHHGHSIMIDEDGEVHVFSHTPIHFPYGVDATGQPTFTGDFSGLFGTPAAIPAGRSLYYGVSPYGPWTIDTVTMDPAKRMQLKKVTVKFSGYAQGRKPALKDKLIRLHAQWREIQ